jgi:uncharacterized protein with PIN domain
MLPAHIRFYAELNDYLSQDKRFRDIAVSTDGALTIRQLLASFAVPDADVDLILLNGTSVDLNHVIGENDRVSVYPVWESLDISSVTRVRDVPLREPKFVLDCHLGKLAYYLRMLGFDTLYRSDFQDIELVALSESERRTLLSRDRRLIEESSISRGYRVRETDPRLQAVEVLHRFDLSQSTRPLQRCLRCNTFLVQVDKNAVIDLLPPLVKEKYTEFQTCPACCRIYWKGSHYLRMQETIAEILASCRAMGNSR